MLPRQALPLLAACILFPAVAPGAWRDIEGKEHPPPGKSGAAATVVYFVTHDCPISNKYAPEIGRICSEYSPEGVRCLMAYVDPTITVADIEQHREAFGLMEPAVHDTDHALVARAGATITPEAAVFDRAGGLAYRGRIDNLYASLGTPRRRATQLDLRRALGELAAGQPVSQPRTQAVGCYIPNLDTPRRGDTP